MSKLLEIEPQFDAKSPTDRILIVTWFLHEHRVLEVFTTDDVRSCFREMHAEPPDVSVYLPRMASKKPPLVVRARGGYRLSGDKRRSLSQLYGVHPTQVAVTQLLTLLPDKLPDLQERVFLQEALACYRVGAFRASIVMTWNLAYDHLRRWIMSDSNRLAALNAAILVRYPKKALTIALADDFDDLKESEILEACRTAKLLSKNVFDILKEKLGRRNKAAHPSSIVVSQHQADDTITDLVNNVLLVLV